MDVIKKKMSALKLQLVEAEKEAQKEEAELAKVNNKADELEKELNKKEKECDEMEEELEKIDAEGRDFTRQLSVAEKITEEGRQARKILESRGATDGKRHADLEGELTLLMNENKEVEKKLLAITKDIDDGEQFLDDAEERVEVASARVKVLEVEAIHLGNSLRSMEVNEQQGVDRVTNKSEKLIQLKRDIEETKERAERAEELYKQRCQECEEKELELDHQKGDFEKLKTDYDALVAELQDL